MLTFDAFITLLVHTYRYAMLDKAASAVWTHDDVWDMDLYRFLAHERTQAFGAVLNTLDVCCGRDRVAYNLASDVFCYADDDHLATMFVDMNMAKY